MPNPNGERLLQPWEISFEEYEKPTGLTFYEGGGADVRASWDFLKRLEAYLRFLMKEGTISQDMADSMWRGQYQKLFPRPQLKQRTQTQEEKDFGIEPPQEWTTPKPVALVDLDFYSAVRSHFEGLGEEERGALETRIGQYADAQATLIQQRGALPLGRGGTLTEQMWTAQGAIRDLQLRKQQVALAAAENPYLWSTAELIDRQISQFEVAQNRLREQARLEARLATRARAPEGERQRPEMPAPTAKGFRAGLERLPPTAQRYFGGRLGEMWQEFEEAFPGAREAWWAALHPRPEPEGEPGTFAQSFATEYGMSPEAAAQTGQRYYADPESPEFGGLTSEQQAGLAWAGMEAMGQPGGRRVEMRDPWQTYLEEYPFMEKFITVPRQQRGFFPRRSVARGRWFV